ncbi:hypothetical protein HFN47_14940 [Rhizobium leguminosarum]|nr:hypothetical protein [Rhizobium leguminosarum]MBY5859133.1 hypothetical protein [Rhizobium leguminosarum]
MEILDLLVPTEKYSLSDATTAVATLLGGLFVVWQYYQNSRVSRARAAADEVASFSNDEAVKLALRLIDWHSGSISYVNAAGVRSSVFFTEQDFHLALRPHSTPRSKVWEYEEKTDLFKTRMQEKNAPCEDLFSPIEQYVRDTFDAFLSRLERVDSLVGSGVIAKKNFGECFSYWLNLIGDPKSKDDKFAHFANAKRNTLIEYIKYYQFTGAQRLFRRYGKKL